MNGVMKGWKTALTLLLLAGLLKAHMLFIRLVILAAAGLAGLFLLHVLAQDYRKIQQNRPKAFGLFKRSIEMHTELNVQSADIDTQFSEAHRHLELLKSIQPVTSDNDNSSLMRVAAALDPAGCARRYICSLAASPPTAHTALENSLLELVQSHKDATKFQAAVQLGKKLMSPKQCAAIYSRCTYSITEMLRLVQPVY